MRYDVTIDHERGRFLAVHAFEAGPEEMAEKQGQAFGTVAAHLAAIGVPIELGDGVESLRLPDVDVATTTHVGPYEQLGMAYDALKQGAEAMGRHVDESAMMWEEYLTGPDSPPEEITTVVHWPLEATRA